MDKNDQLNLDLFLDKWRGIGLSIDPADRPTAEWGVRWLYKLIERPQPLIQWCSSPRGIAKKLSGEVVEELSINRVRNFEVPGFPSNSHAPLPQAGRQFQALRDILINNISTPISIEACRNMKFPVQYDLSPPSIFQNGQFLAGVIGFYDYVLNINAKSEGLTMKADRLSEVYGLTNIANSAGCILALDDICYISERPTSPILLDEDNRLHGEETPAIAYADGFEIWAWHGNLVGEKVIKKQFTHSEITLQPNIEIRRSMMEIYGEGNYLIDNNAEEVHADGFGTLYRLEIPGDEPLAMVKVINSTSEPDGTYKDYFLRVPPNMETAEQAIAWTFNMNESEYQPEKET